MINELRLTIEDLNRHRNIHAGIVVKLDSAIEFLRDIFTAETSSPMPSLPPSAVLPPAKPPQTVTILADPDDVERFRGRKNRRENIADSNGQSRKAYKGRRFKGVKEIVTGRGNAKRTRYEGIYWDGKAKRCRHLGRFDDELAAALAVAKALKDKAEIQRISGMIEQAENNPNREFRGRKTEDGIRTAQDPPAGPAGHVAVIYECNKCGRDHPQAARPRVCTNCGKDHGFYEVK